MLSNHFRLKSKDLMLFFQTKSDGFLKFVSQLSDDNRGPLKNLQNRTHCTETCSQYAENPGEINF